MGWGACWISMMTLLGVLISAVWSLLGVLSKLPGAILHGDYCLVCSDASLVWWDACLVWWACLSQVLPEPSVACLSQMLSVCLQCYLSVLRVPCLSQVLPVCSRTAKCCLSVSSAAWANFCLSFTSVVCSRCCLSVSSAALYKNWDMRERIQIPAQLFFSKIPTNKIFLESTVCERISL